MQISFDYVVMPGDEILRRTVFEQCFNFKLWNLHTFQIKWFQTRFAINVSKLLFFSLSNVNKTPQIRYQAFQKIAVMVRKKDITRDEISRFALGRCSVIVRLKITADVAEKIRSASGKAFEIIYLSTFLSTAVSHWKSPGQELFGKYFYIL